MNNPGLNPRPLVSAGRFYPGDRALLLRQVEACYSHPLGPRDGQAPDRPPLALVVPHGALGHAGPVTAHAFALWEAWSRQAGVFPSRVALLGPDHFGRGAPVSATRLDYCTPLGCVPTALEDVADLCAAVRQDAAPPWLAVAEAGHAQEHALENVLPFLQQWLLAGNTSLLQPSDSPKLLPLTLATHDFALAARLGELLSHCLPAEGTLVIATSDLCHCGPAYGDLPVSAESPERYCRDRMRRVAEVLQTFDPERLRVACCRESWSACGITALAATLHWARLRGAEEVRPLMLADAVAVARGWHSHPDLPRDGAGSLLYPWNLLTEVDPTNPVGFGSFALS